MASSSGNSAAAGSLLRRQLKAMQSDNDIPAISCGLVQDSNIFEWEVMLMINDDCKYYGGMRFSLSPPHECSCSCSGDPLAGLLALLGYIALFLPAAAAVH